MVLVRYCPTATHCQFVRHVTALSASGDELGAFGVRTEAHEIPFQVRARPPAVWRNDGGPTALQEVWLTQLTPESPAVDAMAGLGVTVSAEPSQVSMRGALFPLLSDVPTATQKDEPAQDTDWNKLLVVPGPLAVMIVQALPFHVSARTVE
jgi:hypothetical protein